MGLAWRQTTGGIPGTPVLISSASDAHLLVEGLRPRVRQRNVAPGVKAIAGIGRENQLATTVVPPAGHDGFEQFARGAAYNERVRIVPHKQLSTFGRDGHNARALNIYRRKTRFRPLQLAARCGSISACVVSASVGNGLRGRIPAIASVILRSVVPVSIGADLQLTLDIIRYVANSARNA